jgi:alginate O-acetyltransferase complex protein AlgJ
MISNTRQTLFDHIVFVSLLLVLCTPFLLSGRVVSLLRNGQLQQRLPAVDGHLRDAFPARQTLTAAYFRARYLFFGTMHDSVEPGLDGWLFFRWDAAGGHSNFQDVQGLNRASAAEQRKWSVFALARAAKTAAQKTVFLTLVPPNKETIYPEFLPPKLRDHVATTTRLDDYISTMNEAVPNLVLDLRPSLRASKASGQVFERTDAHWTEFGAYTAYRAVVNDLQRDFPAIKPVPETSFIRRDYLFSGDLVRMAWLEGLIVEQSPRLVPIQTFPAILAGGDTVLGPHACELVWPDQSPRVIITTCPDQSLPAAVVFHDSFMARMVPYLAQHFRRVVWSKDDLDWRVVEREHPDLVIYEKVERSLDLLQKEVSR